MTESSPSAGVPDDPPPFPPFRVLASERIYDCHWCGLRRDLVELRDGRPQEYHVFEIPDATVVVPVLANGDIVLVGQYRYPHGGTHWEAPAGRIDARESPRECAARELREETGYASERLIELPGFYPTNGISPHYAHAFAALDCRLHGAPRPDASEQLIVRRFRREEVRALLAAGRIRDAFSAIALLWWLTFGDAG